MIDCLLIGHNDTDFMEYEKMVKMMGPKSGAYRDLNLHFVQYENQSYRAMDLINHFHYESKPQPEQPFYNGDFISPAILYLGTFLDKHGYTYDYVNSFNYQKEELKNKLCTDDLLTIGITTTLYVSVKPIIEIITFIKKYNTKAKIIVGGPFIATQMRQADRNTIQYLFKSLGADIYVNSIEGEQALVNTLDALKHGKELGQVNNIWYKSGNQYVGTEVTEENNLLEDNLINWNLFKDQVGEFVSLRTSKSCPFSCSFCGFPERAGQYRYVSVETIEKELNALKEVGGVTTLYFIDDTFNVPKERFKDILRMMIKNQYDFKWHFNFRCQFADEETVQLMKEAGCEGVFLGIESGSDTVLENMKKRATVEQYREGLHWLNKYGIISYASFIIGFPGETAETVQMTIDFIEETRPTYYRTQLWYCDPLTPIYRDQARYQIKGSMFQWSHQTMNSDEACNYIDQIFLTVQNSTWLPQNGFEIFSLFYLQRKGMPLEQLHQFIVTFNQLIKNKLQNTSDNNPELYRKISELSQF